MPESRIIVQSPSPSFKKWSHWACQYTFLYPWTPPWYQWLDCDESWKTARFFLYTRSRTKNFSDYKRKEIHHRPRSFNQSLFHKRDLWVNIPWLCHLNLRFFSSSPLDKTPIAFFLISKKLLDFYQEYPYPKIDSLIFFNPVRNNRSVFLSSQHYPYNTVSFWEQKNAIIPFVHETQSSPWDDHWHSLNQPIESS